MNQDEPKPPAGPAPMSWGGDSPAGAPVGGSSPPPGPFGPPGVPPWPAGPGPLGPPPHSPGGAGFLRRHPLLIVLVIVIAAVGIIAVLALALGGVEGDGESGLGGFGKRIGIVKIEGVITDSKEVVKQVHRYRDDKSIKAVVVRIESPGGVVAPSQEIYSELKKLGEKKPIVVSMGAVAASGGYYVACPAKVIYANPGTITGSIGVVMEMANLEGLFDWMKIKNVTIKSGKFKDIGSSSRPMTEDEKKLLQAFVDNVHQQFETAVAQGRKLDPEKVHELANGSIYTGEQAKALGLVDELGDLWDAIAKAAELGGIEGEPRVVWPPEEVPRFFRAFGSWFHGVAETQERLASPVRVLYLLQVGGQ